MKAVSIKEKGTAEVIEVSDVTLATDEVKLKLDYVGICGTDLSTYLGKNALVSYPRIPGHEISGTITEIGSDVPKDQGYDIGRKVTVVPYTSCGKCASCKRGRFNACEFNQTLGVQRDGAMSEYFNVPKEKILFADGLSSQQLALVEPLTVGFHAVERGRAETTDTVMVLGCGMIGMGAIIGSSLKGAKVIAVDIDDKKLALAKEFGASHGLNALSPSFEKDLKEITDNFGPDLIVEAVGNAITYRTAIEQVAFTGRVVCIGYSGQDIALPTNLIVKKEIDVMGSRNATKSDFEAVISYLQKEDKSDLLVTKEVSPEEVNEAIHGWSEKPGEVMKILVKF